GRLADQTVVLYRPTSLIDHPADQITLVARSRGNANLISVWQIEAVGGEDDLPVDSEQHVEVAACLANKLRFDILNAGTDPMKSHSYRLVDGAGGGGLI